VFTLDDGFSDQYELATPIFNKYDIPYTCFVITDFLDQKLWPWDEQLKYIFNQTKKTELNIEMPNGSKLLLNIRRLGRRLTRQKCRIELKRMDQNQLYQWLESLYEQAEVTIPSRIPDDFRPMTWNQAQELINQGHDIAPHTQSHRILSKLSDDQARKEIVGSFQKVHEKLTGARNLFAFPTGCPGDFSEREYTYLKEAGAQHAVTMLGCHATPQAAQFELPRYALPENRFDFIQYLSYIEALKSKLFG
jgi:peptidoglycan/xylan/chitin deacetylase (PgdA/CDA1 family)